MTSMTDSLPVFRPSDRVSAALADDLYEWRPAGVDGGRVVAPKSWGQTAVKILADKYLRKAGVPDRTVPDDDDRPQTWFGPGRPDLEPAWLRPSVAAPGARFGAEADARQVFHRLAGAWAYWAWRGAYFASHPAGEESRLWAFYEASLWHLVRQEAAPNSPQWFNTGLHWAYGIEHREPGHFVYDPSTGAAADTGRAYLRPTASACFISPVADTLTGDGGITDLVAREAAVFKRGAGNGTNVSAIRAEGEPLSGGGQSSGLMSFLKPLDASAGAIKSGGTTRRAARMLVLDDDHPDLLSYAEWKLREEDKVAALAAGGGLLVRHRERILAACWPGGVPAAVGLPAATAASRPAVAAAAADGVPAGYLDRVVRAAAAGIRPPGMPDTAEMDGRSVPYLNTDWRGEAYATVSGQNANNSVRLTDAFMRKATGDDPDPSWRLRHRTDPGRGTDVNAREVFRRMMEACWASADPGAHFADTMNRWNTVPEWGTIKATNPCSEFVFLDDTACNLASLNLVAFLDRGVFDLDRFLEAVDHWTTVLEVTVGMASYPSAELAANSHLLRPLGLGYANLGSLLMRLGLAYDSDAGRDLAAAVTAALNAQALLTSANLAEAVGPYARFDVSRASHLKVVKMHLAAANEYDRAGVTPLAASLWSVARATGSLARAEAEVHGLRNAQVTVIAPTGTIGMVMGCDTTGVEPDYALVKWKALVEGGGVTLVNEAVGPALDRLGYLEDGREAVLAHIRATGRVEGCDRLRPEHLAVFDCAAPPPGSARAVSPDGHVLMLAAVQPFLSGAASKTVNLPADATVEDVERAFVLAWRSGVKCVAVYRDGSKMSQPLSAAGATAEPPSAPKGAARSAACGREALPARRRGFTQKVRVGGQKVYLRTGEYPDGRLGELFLTVAKEGSSYRSILDAFAQAVSIGLQNGAPLADFVDAFVGTRFEPSGVVAGHDRVKAASSVLDYVFRDLGVQYLGDQSLADVSPDGPEGDEKPAGEAAAARAAGYTGDLCLGCHGYTMVRSGSCLRCDRCGYAGGCG